MSEAPHISIITQYIKDFSFENPLAPSSLAAGKNPAVELSLDINITKLEEEDFYEVEIAIEAKANQETQVLFVVDLKYAGVFNLINIPEEQESMLLAVHCPALIFPFARQIIANITQAGGFQPLMIDPIDFGILYHKKMTEKQN